MFLYLLYIYAALLIFGGLIGYKKAGSKISLFMGIASGIIVFSGCLLIKSNPSTGFLIILVTAAILTTAFAIRLKKTKKFMPSGLLIIVSLIALVIAFSQLTG